MDRQPFDQQGLVDPKHVNPVAQPLRPDDLARLMMERAAKRPASDVDKLLASGEEQWVKFEDKWPVYILYFTAFVNDDGSVRFHHDVYGRDEKIESEKKTTVT